MKKPIPLQEFWKDKATKDNLQNYLVEFLKEQAVKEIFDNESESNTQALAQAKRYIDLAFDNMDLLFEGKAEKKEVINEAR
jgi:hypothetical protein